MTDSQRLLADYATNGSETAFRELVSRYLNLVYSAAIRLVGGDTHLAQDVAQTVFVDLARKASTLPPDVMLGGWLHRHTCFVASKIIRGERRRQSRERWAVAMNEQPDYSEANLAHVAPILDEAINQLDTGNRMAILLRFFEQRDLRSVGEALGSNENAAQKQVSRALEELRVLLKKRGVAFSAAVLGTALASEAVTAAPAGLAGAISTVALAGAAGTGTTLTVLKLMANTKLKLGLATLVIAGAAATLVIQHQSQIKLREENQSFRQQIAQLKADNGSLSSLAIQANKPASLPGDQFEELLRLRGNAEILQQQTRELARLRQENRKLSQVPAQSAPTNQVSAEDQAILRQTHAVDAMTALLIVVKSFATNHGGQYPESFDQLVASGDLVTTNFAGNLGLDDFEIKKDGTVDPQGNPVILSLRVPIPSPGHPFITVFGLISDSGVVQTEIFNISP